MEFSVPTDILLLTNGDNDSSKGKMKYSPERAEEFNKIFEKLGRIPWDRDHLQLSENDSLDAKSSYGWSLLHADEDGIWARDTQWTEEGEQLLRSGKYRKFSVAGFVDKEENFTGIINIALTNLSADPFAFIDRQVQRSMTIDQEVRDVTLLRDIDLHNLEKDNNPMQKKKKDVQQVVEQPEVIARSEDEESEDEKESTEERVEETPEQQKVEDSTMEDLQKQIDSLKEDNEGLKAMLEELSSELASYRKRESEEVDEKEMEEKRSLLKNRSEKVRSWLMKKPLAEVKEQLRHFSIGDKEPVVEPKSTSTVVDDYDVSVKRQLGLIDGTSKRGFGLNR